MKFIQFVPTVLALSMLTSAALASGNHHKSVEYGTVLDVETVWTTQIQSQPYVEKNCAFVEQRPAADLGAQIIGGLIGSGIGNSLSSKDGAGTAGAVLGMMIASRDKSPHYVERCSEQVKYKRTHTKIPSHYRIKASVDGQVVYFDSDSPYQRYQTIPVTIHSRYSLHPRRTY
jgi:uncharacterized protein YcfJ